MKELTARSFCFLAILFMCETKDIPDDRSFGDNNSPGTFAERSGFNELGTPLAEALRDSKLFEFNSLAIDPDLNNENIDTGENDLSIGSLSPSRTPENIENIKQVVDDLKSKLIGPLSFESDQAQEKTAAETGQYISYYYGSTASEPQLHNNDLLTHSKTDEAQYTVMLNNPFLKADQSNPEVPAAVLYSLGKKQGVQFSNVINNLGTNVDQFQKDNSHFLNNLGVKAGSSLINNVGLASDQSRKPSRSKIYTIGANTGAQYPGPFSDFAANIENSDNELSSAVHTSIGTQYPNFIGNLVPNIDKLNNDMSPNQLYSFGTNTGTQYSNLISNLGSNTDPFSKDYSSAILNSMNINAGTRYPNLISNLESNTDQANRELAAIIHEANTGAKYSNMISNLGPNADQSNQGLSLAVLNSLATPQPHLAGSLGLNTDQAQKEFSSGVLYSEGEFSPMPEFSGNLYSNTISQLGLKPDQSKHELSTLLHDLGITTGSQYNNLINTLAADQSNKEMPPAILYSGYTGFNSEQTYMDSSPRYNNLLQQSPPGFSTGSKNNMNSVLNSAFERGYALHNAENLQNAIPYYHATSTHGDGLNLISKNPSTSQISLESGSYIPSLQQPAIMQNIKHNYFTQDNLPKYKVSSLPTYIDKISYNEQDKIFISPSVKTQPTQQSYLRLIAANEYIMPHLTQDIKNKISCQKEGEIYKLWTPTYQCLVCACISSAGAVHPVCTKCDGCTTAATEPVVSTTTPAPIQEVSCSPLPQGYVFENPLNPCQVCICVETIDGDGRVNAQIKCQENFECVLKPESTLTTIPDVPFPIPYPTCERLPANVDFPHPSDSCRICKCIKKTLFSESKISCVSIAGCETQRPSTLSPVAELPRVMSTAIADIVPTSPPSVSTPMATGPMTTMPKSLAPGPLPGPKPHESCHPFTPQQMFQHPWDECLMCVCTEEITVGHVTIEVNCYTKRSCCYDGQSSATAPAVPDYLSARMSPNKAHEQALQLNSLSLSQPTVLDYQGSEERFILPPNSQSLEIHPSYTEDQISNVLQHRSEVSQYDYRPGTGLTNNYPKNIYRGDAPGQSQYLNYGVTPSALTKEEALAEIIYGSQAHIATSTPQMFGNEIRNAKVYQYNAELAHPAPKGHAVPPPLHPVYSAQMYQSPVYSHGSSLVPSQILSSSVNGYSPSTQIQMLANGKIVLRSGEEAESNENE